MMTSPQSEPGLERRFTLGQFAAFLLIVGIAFSSQMAMPLWIGAVMDDYNLSRTAVGAIGAAEMMAVAVTSLLMSVRIHRFPAKLSILIGIALLTIGNLGSGLFDSANALTLSRMLVGCGKGVVVTMAFSIAAGTSHPTRVFAVVNAGYALFSMLLFLIIPPLVGGGGAQGIFTFLSSLALLSLVALAWFPNRFPIEEASGPRGGVAIPVFGFIAFAALLCMATGFNAVWTFIERIGLESGLDAVQVGRVLSVAAFVTVFGAGMARVIDTRFGHTLPVIIALSLEGVLCLLIVYLLGTTVFQLSVPLFMLLAMFSIPYFMGILSLADPAGRLTAAASAAMTIGHAIGSLGGGWTADQFGYEGLSWFGSSCLLVSILLLILITPRIRFPAARAISQH